MDDHESLAKGTSGQFFSPFMILDSARSESRRASSISVQIFGDAVPQRRVLERARG